MMLNEEKRSIVITVMLASIIPVLQTGKFQLGSEQVTLEAASLMLYIMLILALVYLYSYAMSLSSTLSEKSLLHSLITRYLNYYEGIIDFYAFAMTFTAVVFLVDTMGLSNGAFGIALIAGVVTIFVVAYTMSKRLSANQPQKRKK